MDHPISTGNRGYIMEYLKYNEEFQWIKEYRLLIKREEETVLEHFSNWLKEYIKNIDSMGILGEEDRLEIRNFGYCIKEVLETLDMGDISNAYSIFLKKLNSIKQHLPYGILGIESGRCLEYYRINWEAEFEYSYKQMLHVPFSLRHIISSGRYSMAGMPCTYMATSKDVAWYESKMPNKFYIAKFSSYEGRYKLLRLDLNPLSMHREIKHIEGNEQKYERIKSYCMVFPLLVGCSYSIKYIGAKFCEEYQLSQMLMTWLKQDADFIGIRYSSSSRYDDIRNNEGHNIAIPIREIDDEGYCKFLQQRFNTANDKAIKKVNLKDCICQFKALAEGIRTYYNELKYEQQHKEFPMCYNQFLTICEVFIENWDSIISYNVQEHYSSIVTIQKLWSWADNIKSVDEKDILESASGTVLDDDEKEAVGRLIRGFDIKVVQALKEFRKFAYKMLAVINL